MKQILHYLSNTSTYIVVSLVVVCMVYTLSACGNSSNVPNVSYVPAGSVGASVSVVDAPTRIPTSVSPSKRAKPTDAAAAKPEDTQAKEPQNANGGNASQNAAQKDTEEKAVTDTPSDPRAYMYTVYSGEGFEVIERVMPRCTSCHRISDEGKRSGPGPSLNGLKNRAGSRVEGLSAKEYVRQSILDPRAFTVDQCPLGPCPEIMPDTYPEQINADDLDTLINFLLSLEEE